MSCGMKRRFRIQVAPPGPIMPVAPKVMGCFDARQGVEIGLFGLVIVAIAKALQIV